MLLAELWLEIARYLPLPRSHKNVDGDGTLSRLAISCKMLHRIIENATNEIIRQAQTAQTLPGTYISVKDFANNCQQWIQDGTLGQYRFSMYLSTDILWHHLNRFVVHLRDVGFCYPIARDLHLVPLEREQAFSIVSYINDLGETRTPTPLGTYKLRCQKRNDGTDVIELDMYLYRHWAKDDIASQESKNSIIAIKYKRTPL